MIDIKFLREHPDIVKHDASAKGVEIDVEKILTLDRQVRELETRIGEQKHAQNEANREISKFGGPEPFRHKELKRLSDEIKNLDHKISDLKIKLTDNLLKVPNLLKEDVLMGKDDSENQVLRKMGNVPKFSFGAKDYLAIARDLDLLDLEGPAKSSGTRFSAIKGKAAILEFAIVRWVFDALFKEGFTPIIPPVLIQRDAMTAMGYLEQSGEEEVYHLPDDDLYLVGTSEQSIGPLHRNEILDYDNLPLRYVGFSTCFRREAGSYGKDTKGILRVHQFDKCEMFSFTHSEQSDDEHRFFLKLEEQFMQQLKLPYQVINICSGDLGFPAARKWDIETWIPSEGRYRETHSTSTCTDFQGRRLSIRTKNPKTKKSETVHTVNGTAFAMGRILIAILEHYQQADGSVRIPDILQPYAGFSEIRSKNE